MIIWSPEAEIDYHSNIEYLLNRWTEREAIHFIETTETVLKLIVQKPESFRSTGYKKIRTAVILPQISLYYVPKENGDIELIRFWNNYQNPKRLEL